MGHQAWPNEKSSRCFSLRLDGLTYGEIAKEMGITRSMVSGYLHRHGISATDSSTPPVVKAVPAPANDCRAGTYPFEVPKPRRNDDRLHLTLMLAALREQRAS